MSNDQHLKAGSLRMIRRCEIRCIMRNAHEPCRSVVVLIFP